MRSRIMKRATYLYAMTAVLMSLAVAAAYSQSQTQNAPRVRSRSDWQQTGAMPPAGQPDFARRMADRHARNIQEMQQDIERMQRWAKENHNRAIQQALRAPDDQWRRLKPRLDRIERLKAEAEVALDPGSAGGSAGFQGQAFTFGGGSAGGMDPNGAADARSNAWGRSWTLGPKSAMEMSEGEVLCEELRHLLQGESVPPAQIAQKVAALRQIRAQARDELAKARQELRGLLVPHQEPVLIVMGYLD